MRSRGPAAALGLVLVTLVPVRALPASGADGREWVLRPAAEGEVRALSKAVSEAAGLPAGPIRIAGSEVVLVLRGPDGPIEVHVAKDGVRLPDPPPPGWDEERARRVAEAAAAPLPWVPVDPAGSGSTRPPAPSRPIPPTDEAESARIQAAVMRNLALREGREAPPSGPAPPCARCLERPPVDPARAAREVRGVPKLRVAAALESLAKGRVEEAVAWADAATRMPRADADALLLWGRLTGAAVAIPPDADPPLLLRASPLSPSVPSGTLLALAGAVLLAGSLLRRPRAIGAGLVAVPLAAGAAGWFLASTPPVPPGVLPPALPASLLAPLAGGPCEADPALRTAEGLEVHATCDGRPASFLVRSLHRDETPEPGGPAAHRVVVRGRDQGAWTDAAAARLASAVREAEAGGFRASPLPASAVPRVRPLPGTPGDVERRLAASLVAAGGAGALVLLVLLLAFLFRETRSDRRLGAGLAFLALATVLLHVLLPGRMVMAYTGYDLAARLLGQADLPRYGAGSVWLYRPFVVAFGADHASIQLANRVLGALTLVPVAALAAALLPGLRTGVLVAAGLFALLPLFLRDHVSEGIVTGTTFLLATGLAGLALGLLRDDRRALLGLAFPVLAAAATCRPEVTVTLLPALLGLALAARRMPWAGAFALAFALVPHLVWLEGVVSGQLATEGIVPLEEAALVRLPRILSAKNVFLEGPWLPRALLVFAALALAGGRRALPWVLGFAAAALAWMGTTAADLPEVSIPRVHVPAVLLALPAAGLGAEVLASAFGGRIRIAAAAVLVAIAAEAAWSIPPLFARSNEDDEEELVRAAEEAVRSAGGCLVTVGFEDPPPAGHTQRHFPRYLFPGGAVAGLGRAAEVSSRCDGTTFALLGTRCFMDFRQPEDPIPPAPGEIEACRRFREVWSLEPVVRRTVPNRTEHTFPMYPDAETLDLGLYRVVGPAPPAAATP